MDVRTGQGLRYVRAYPLRSVNYSQETSTVAWGPDTACPTSRPVPAFHQA